MVLVEAQDHSINPGQNTIVSRLNIRKINKLSAAMAALRPPIQMFYRPRISTDNVTFSKFNATPESLFTLSAPDTFEVMKIPVDMPFYYIDIIIENFDAKPQNIDLVVFGI